MFFLYVYYEGQKPTHFYFIKNGNFALFKKTKKSNQKFFHFINDSSGFNIKGYFNYYRTCFFYALTSFEDPNYNIRNRG